jgi:EmrB/QacA subfamily drug resistance transporter
MAFIDGSVVNVALPAIQEHLGASLADMQWVVNAYMLLLGALILPGGSAGDHYGRRRIFALGIALFTGASVWCGLAPNVTQLILARGLQGIGGALMVPSSLAIISATYDRKTRGRAIGTWAGFSALTTAFGPIIGGWLVDTISWRLIFFINVPIAIAALAITFLHVPESRDRRGTGGLDWTGTALATSGLGGVIYGLTEGGPLGWGNPAIIASLAIGTLLLILFVRVEAASRAPMMPLGLFGSSTFSGANLLTLLLYFALSGAFFFLPFNLIQVHGYSATEAGGAFLPFPLLMGGLSRWSGGLIERYGAKLPLIVGPVIVAIGYLLLALPGTGGSYWTTFFPAMVVTGLGMTDSVAPLTTAVMGSVDEGNAGVASGVNNAVSRVAGTLAVAVLGIVAIASFAPALESRIASLPLSSAAHGAITEQHQRLAAIEIPRDIPPERRQGVKQAIDMAFLGSFRLVMVIAAALALGSALVSWLMIDTGGGETRQA